MSQKLIDAIIEKPEEDPLRITNELLDEGMTPEEILDACQETGRSNCLCEKPD